MTTQGQDDSATRFDHSSSKQKQVTNPPLLVTQLQCNFDTESYDRFFVESKVHPHPEAQTPSMVAIAHAQHLSFMPQGSATEALTFTVPAAATQAGTEFIRFEVVTTAAGENPVPNQVSSPSPSNSSSGSFEPHLERHRFLQDDGEDCEMGPGNNEDVQLIQAEQDADAKVEDILLNMEIGRLSSPESCSPRSAASEKQKRQGGVKSTRIRKPRQSRQPKQPVQRAPRRVITKCPHVERMFYAKGRCKNCYHASGREKKTQACPHFDRPAYAHGVCKNCYLSKYHRERRAQRKRLQTADKPKKDGGRAHRGRTRSATATTTTTQAVITVRTTPALLMQASDQQSSGSEGGEDAVLSPPAPANLSCLPVEPSQQMPPASLDALLAVAAAAAATAVESVAAAGNLGAKFGSHRLMKQASSPELI